MKFSVASINLKLVDLQIKTLKLRMLVFNVDKI